MARGDGATTRQMQAAPKGAYFVWVNSQLDYPKCLAVKVCREDLRIVSPDFFADDYRWRGIEFTGIVIDHAAHLSDRTLLNIRRCKRQPLISKQSMNEPTTSELIAKLEVYAAHGRAPLPYEVRDILLAILRRLHEHHRDDIGERLA